MNRPPGSIADRPIRSRRALYHLAGLAVTLIALVIGAAPAHAQDRITELVSTGSNGAFDAYFGGSSADGKRVFFSTVEALTSDDTDGGHRDVYERSGATTTLISAGANGPFHAVFDGASADGGRVFFTTEEKLTADDTDGGHRDVYARSGATTTLVSAGSNLPVSFEGASADGTRVFIETFETLTSDDTDGGHYDVYERSAATTTLVSVGANAPNSAFFGGASADGTRVFFITDAQLAIDDIDGGHRDVYARSGGTTTLVSAGGNGPFHASFEAASANGTRAFFSTNERLMSTDTDGGPDVYERSGATTTLVSVGTKGIVDTSFVGASADGMRVFLTTDGPLTSDDTDGALDVFERAGATTTLVSTGTSTHVWFGGNSSDGTRVFLETRESLASADNDGKFDVYERSGGATTLVSAGADGPFDVSFSGVSADGTRVFFDTDEPMTTDDTDGTRRDVYVARVPRPPETSIDSGPQASTEDSTPTFTFSASHPGATFECRIDAGPFAPCSSPFTAAPLAPGSHAFEVRATVAGEGTDATPARRAFSVDTAIVVVRDTVAPRLSRVAIANRRFATSRRARSRTPVGTAFRFVLSEAATVRITILRARAGRRVAGRCAEPTRGNRRRAPCVRSSAVGALTHASSAAGRASVRFYGRLGRRMLRPGAYVARIVATDAAGNGSKPASLRFTVAKR